MTDDSLKSDYRPTKTNIEKQFENLLGTVLEEDLIFIAFSGHGASNAGESFLCPGDTNPNRPDTMISRQWLTQQLEESPSQHRIFLVDACRNEIFSSGAKSVSGTKSLETEWGDLPGVYQLSSCSPKQQSWEDPALKQGVFTHFFVTGMSDSVCDVNKDGNIDLLELFTYTRDKTIYHVRSTFNEPQRPTFKLSGELSAPIVLANIDVKPTVIEDKPLPVLPSTYLSSAGTKFVKIESGEFMMGDTLSPEDVDKQWPGGKVEWYEVAHPRHKVTISKPFYMGIHEVTVGEFRAFVKDTGYKTTAEKESSSFGMTKEGKYEYLPGLSWQNVGIIEQTSSHPVVHVSLDDAIAYIAWLNEHHLPVESLLKGYRYSLPSEAQWEYACRAGTTTSFFWGESDGGGKGYLNGAGKEGAPNGGSWSYPFPFDDGYKGTSPVGSFKPNAWGLYDMLGNVWEWCSDRYGAYPSGAVTDPTGPNGGSHRVHRGGSWNNCARNCRSAYRDRFEPSYRDDILGLRVSLAWLGLERLEAKQNKFLSLLWDKTLMAQQVSSSLRTLVGPLIINPNQLR